MKLIVITIIAFLNTANAFGQAITKPTNNAITPKPKTPVTYLTKFPIIDGVLDEELNSLEPMDFNYIWQFDNPITDTARVTYRMAYTAEFLYLYIETNVDSISYHRRGYLWGDGYKLLLGIPQKDSLTNEYFELSFSPTLEEYYAWDKQRIMNYNFNQNHKKLSIKTISQEKAINGKSGFEALIAWSDIRPYHPWFIKEMGYNVYFAKGIESEKYGYITNGYAVVEDEGIWDEEVPKRNYQLLDFEQPKFDSMTIVLMRPKKQNLISGEVIVLTSAAIGVKNNTFINVALKNENSKVVFTNTLTCSVDNKLGVEEYELKIDDLPMGKYNLEIAANNEIKTFEISVLPNIPYKKIEKAIALNPSQLPQMVINTLLFKLQELNRTKNGIKDYETGIGLINQWASFEQDYNEFKNGSSHIEVVHHHTEWLLGLNMIVPSSLILLNYQRTMMKLLAILYWYFCTGVGKTNKGFWIELEAMGSL